MGEKPTEADEAERKQGSEQQDLRESPTPATSGGGSPAGIAVSDPGVPSGRVFPETNNREGFAINEPGESAAKAAPERPPVGPQEATNLNSSRSNIYRQGAPDAGDEPPEPSEATTINTTRSNTFREGAPDAGGEPESLDATTVKGSKSNSDD